MFNEMEKSIKGNHSNFPQFKPLFWLSRSPRNFTKYIRKTYLGYYKPYLAIKVKIYFNFFYHYTF